MPNEVASQWAEVGATFAEATPAIIGLAVSALVVWLAARWMLRMMRGQ